MKLDSEEIALAAVVTTALVATSATLFGFRFAAEAHGHGASVSAEAQHAETGEAGEDPEHEDAEEEDGREEESGAGKVASAILISIGGAALVPLTLLLRRRRRPAHGVRAESEAESESGLGRALRVGLSLLSGGAALIHFAVIAEHWNEWWLTGTFFVIVAAVQLVWSVEILRRPSRLLYLVGAVVNALVVATWIVSRTAGAPVGPGAGEPEPVGLPDVLATLYEVLLVAGSSVLLLRARAARCSLRPLASAAGTWVIASAVVSLTALALARLP